MGSSLRILVVIPHYWRPEPGALPGSRGADATPRAAALTEGLVALWTLFGAPARYYRYRAGERAQPCEANGSSSARLDVVVCTTGEHHLLAGLSVSSDVYRHHPVACEDPRELGFECHAVLRAALGSYDYYCYMEDDLVLHDPAFFEKLCLFDRATGGDSLLQPHLYEIARTGSPRKVYVDPSAESPARLSFGRAEGFVHDATKRVRVPGRYLGRPLAFTTAVNAHSGCFFLTEAQLRRWVASGHFLDRDSRLYSAPHSASCLGLMKTFHVFKPDWPNASYLELQHWGEVYCGRMPRYRYLK